MEPPLLTLEKTNSTDLCSWSVIMWSGYTLALCNNPRGLAPQGTGRLRIVLFCARRFLIRQRRMFLRLLFTIESCLMDHSSRRRSRPSSKFPVGMIGAPWHKHQLALVQCHPKETPALGIISPPPLLQTFTVHKLSA